MLLDGSEGVTDLVRVAVPDVEGIGVGDSDGDLEKDWLVEGSLENVREDVRDALLESLIDRDTVTLAVQDTVLDCDWELVVVRVGLRSELWVGVGDGESDAEDEAL
jgi:hypothetical protein